MEAGNEMGPPNHKHEVVDQSQSKGMGPTTAADA